MKTKLSVLLCIIFILSLALGACSSSQATSSTGSGNSSQNNDSLSKVNMLLVGTLRLEDSEKAITSEEAATILPLWQAYRALSTSQTAAEAEVEALLNQIESTMTTEQVQAIEAMNLTSKDMLNLMQSMGPVMGPGGTPDPQSTPGFDFPGGVVIDGNPPDIAGGGPSGGSTSGGTTRNFPPGGVISGGPRIENFSMGDAGSAAGLGGGPMMQGTPDPSMKGTAEARFSTQASQVNSMLLNVLISKLEALTTK